MLRSSDVHASLGRDGWTHVLEALGIEQRALTGRAGPCPACGGRDRFHFDRDERGGFYCRHCGPGSGFDLLMRTHGWDFTTALRRVIEAAGLSDPRAGLRVAVAPASPALTPATPSAHVRRLWRSSCAIADCAPAVTYLRSRALWPLPRIEWRAHVSVPYFDENRRCIARYPALLAPVRDANGESITLHVTYLTRSGQKLPEPYTARKLLGKLTLRESPAVHLMPPDGEVLGIGEGLETALSAHRLHHIPVWAALNTTLLAKFLPPPQIRRLMIFADNDPAGLDAAQALRSAISTRVDAEIVIPASPRGDFNDDLVAVATIPEGAA